MIVCRHAECRALAEAVDPDDIAAWVPCRHSKIDELDVDQRAGARMASTAAGERRHARRLLGLWRH